MKRITPENIDSLEKNEIFVFGSNEAGHHGVGAAFMAIHKFGAIYKIGFGIQGQSFAIPTKDWNIKTLPIDQIERYVKKFIQYTQEEPKYTYLVTKIGCGLAGYTVNAIAPLFVDAFKYENIALPVEFWEWYNKGVVL